MILDRRLSFVYFPNNKVCQTSIARRALSHRTVVRKDSRLLWEYFYWRTARANKKKEIFTYTVARNPYDLVVSAFFYLKNKNELVDAYDNFATFCKDCLRSGRENVDPHFLPQTECLFRGGRQVVDVIARFETIGDDWKTIADAIGEPNTILPVANKSKRSNDWLKYYDKEALRIVAGLYHDDFRLLGYEIVA